MILARQAVIADGGHRTYDTVFIYSIECRHVTTLTCALGR